MPATVSVCIVAQTDFLRRLYGPRSLIDLSVPHKLRQNMADTHAKGSLSIDAAQFLLFDHVQKVDAVPANKPMLLLDFLD